MNHPEPHDLTALAYALVSGPEREQLLEHIASCDACREVYDAAFEEQAQVREVMFEEVRSGEAEARALDKVLQALKTGQVVTEEKQGKVLGLFSPFAIGLQIAAALMIAAGVFYVAVVMPENGTTPPETPIAENAGDKPGIPVKGGDVMVLADSTPDLENGSWSRAASVPLSMWCRNDNNVAVSFTLDGVDLQFEPGAYFQLQPSNGDVSIYMLRGDASVINSSRVLNIITNTNEFRALPGSTFDVECQFAFMPSQRGKEVQAPEGQTLVQAEVKQGKVIFVPSGEGWESPRGGVLVAGRKFDVKNVGSHVQGLNPGIKQRAEGAEFDEKSLEEALGKLKELQPKLHDELRIVLKRYEEQNERSRESETVVKVILENRLELTQTNSRIEIKDPKRTVILTIDKDNLVAAEVTINGETKTYKAASLDELAQKCPAIADLLGSVTLETPSEGKRKVSLKRAVYEQQEVQEEKQQKQSQKVK